MITKICDVCVHENEVYVPRGFRVGVRSSRTGRAYIHVTRLRDGVTVLCPLTPSSEEVLEPREMREELNAACDLQTASRRKELE